jgi:hypothetical protein
MAHRLAREEGIFAGTSSWMNVGSAATGPRVGSRKDGCHRRRGFRLQISGWRSVPELARGRVAGNVSLLRICIPGRKTQPVET